MRSIQNWEAEVSDELRDNILPWWVEIRDKKRGGWYGHYDNKGRPDKKHVKGIVMHARFLWTYSHAFERKQKKIYREMAEHAKEFILERLWRGSSGGFHWMIDRDGVPTVDRIVIYGQAFAVYALSEYARVFHDARTLGIAMETFRLIEKHARDPKAGGYVEAVSLDWSSRVKAKLGEGDTVCDKSMNTNLHIMEAWAGLYKATRDAAVKKALADILEVFLHKIRHFETNLALYFDMDWKPIDAPLSFGHDIEATWLMTEASELVNDGEVPETHKAIILGMVDAIQAVAKQHGPGLINEEHHGHFDKNRIWWVQAEAVVGFLNAYQLTGAARYLKTAQSIWAYAKEYISDSKHGEWFWGRDEEQKTLKQPKGGVWKTPWHVARACMEVLERIERIQQGDHHG